MSDASHHPTLQPGVTLGHFEIERTIGAGGMGVVYEARDSRLGRRVALKVLRRDLFQNETARNRFIREAQIAASISHPNVATIYEVDEAQGTPFIAMELVPGSNLKTLMALGSLSEADILAIAIQVCDGLQAAHRVGVIHRDVKPSNIVVSPDNHVKVLDFGLAKALAELPSGTGSGEDTTPRQAFAFPPGESDPELTHPGVTVGTPSYMSPEQARGEKLDARSDLFSLGTVMYRAASRRLPFVGSTEGAILNSIRTEDPKSLGKGDGAISPAFADVVRRCLEKDPDKRFESAAALKRALEELSEREHGATRFLSAIRFSSARARGWMLSALVLTVVAIGAAVALLLLHDPETNSTQQDERVWRIEDRRVGILAFKGPGGETPVSEWPLLIQALLVNELSGVSELRVVDPLSLNSLLETVFGSEDPLRGRDLYDLLHEEKLAILIDGTIVPSDLGVRLQANLVDPATGEVRYSHAALVLDDRDLATKVTSLANALIGFLRVHFRGLDRDSDIQPWISLRKHEIEAVRSFLQASQYAYRYHTGGEKHLRRAIELDPTFVSPRIWLLASLVRQGKLGEAQQHYETLLAQDQNASPFEQAMIAWAGALLQQDLSAQVRHLDMALEYSPWNNILLFNLGLAHFEMNACEAALDAITPSVNARFRYPPLYVLWGLCNISLRRMDEAKRGLGQALEVGRVDPYVYALWEAVSIAENDMDAAERYEKLFADRFIELGREPEASSVARVYRDTGTFCLETGARGRAEILFRKAIESDPRSPENYDRLGDALLSRGNTTAARAQYLEALEMDPEWPYSHWKLGQLFEKTGDHEKAIHHYERFASRAPTNADARKARDRIEALR